MELSLSHDAAWLLWINQGWRHFLTDALFGWVSERWTFAFPLLALFLADSIRRAGRQGAWLWLWLALTVACGDMLGAWLKSVLVQPRPCFDLFPLVHTLEGHACGPQLTGMPSNHTLNFFAAAMFVYRAVPWRLWHVVLWMVAVLVGLSRIYLAKHYPGQVLTGAGLGMIIGWCSAWPAGRFLRLPGRTLPAGTPSFIGSEIMTENPQMPLKTLPEHHLSIVIPLYNEEENVQPLLSGVHEALDAYPHPWELILVDDGSQDETSLRLHREAERYGSHVRVLTLQRNFGQTAAMQAGLDAARGEVIATLDGDLQNDPGDIPRLVERLLLEDRDLIVGWRRNRKDNLWLRKIPSRLANRLIAKITGVRLHDYGCSLKIYRASVIRNVRLYGEMHRFIPAWVALYTAPARITEEVVQHHARRFGESKYGITRTFRVIVDLLSVYFFMRFLTRPGHFFGRIGLLSGFLGTLALGYLFIIKFFVGADIGNRPLLMTGILLVLMGVQFLTTGVLGELMARTYFATGNNRTYVIRHSHSLEDAGWKADKLP